MALLRLSDGRIFTSFEDINRIVAPLEVGAFDVDQQVLDQAEAFPQPLSYDDAMFLLNSVPEADVDRIGQQGFTHKRLGVVVPPSDDFKDFRMALRFEGQSDEGEPMVLTEKEIADYMTPHHVMVNDVHFVFSGAIVKGVAISEELQGVVYCPAGNWIRLSPKVLNWPIFPRGTATAAASFFDLPCEGMHDMDLKPEVPIQNTMMF